MNRHIQSLDGIWDLRFDPGETGLASGWATDGSILFDRAIEVPSTWNTIEPEYEGIAFYRRMFAIDECHRGQVVRLRFHAVNYCAEVFLNGAKLGRHEGGYTPFEFDISNTVRFSEENLLVVRVIDPPNDGSGRAVDGLRHMEIPSGKESWYVNFSGVWQHVELVVTDRTYIEDVLITTDVEKRMVQARIIVRSGETCDGSLTLSVTSPDRSQALAPETRLICIEPGANLAIVKLTSEQFSLWEPDNPVLYTLHAHLSCDNSSADSVSVRFGMRSFDIRENFFHLNGKKIILRGLLHQQQYPKTLAYAESKDEIRRIIRLLKEGGWNLIRIHIRPTTPDFLGVCDEEGMLIFEEPAIGWIVESESLRERALTEVREMVRRDRNHPSVVIWGILNESGVRGAPDILGRTKMYWNQSDMGVQKIKPELARTIREEDPCRIISDDSGAVTCNYYFPGSSEPVRYYDNHLYMSYPLSHAGFEVSRSLGLPEDFFRSHQFETFHINHRIAGGSPDKLFLQSEFGCGGIPMLPEVLKYYDDDTRITYRDEAVYRRIDSILRDYYDRELTGVFSSYEETLRETQVVQAASIRRMVEALRANERCAGYVFTQLHDNDYECNAGILDPLFRPKLAYEAAKEANRPLRVILETWERTVYTGSSYRVTVTVVNDAVIGGSMELEIIATAPDGGEIFSHRVSFDARRGICEVYEGKITTGDTAGWCTTTARISKNGTVLDSATYNTYVLPKLESAAQHRPVAVIAFGGAVLSWLEKHGVSVSSVNSAHGFPIEDSGMTSSRSVSSGKPTLYIVEPVTKKQLADSRIASVLDRVKRDGSHILFLGLPLICLSDADEELQELRDQGKYVCWCSPTELETEVFDFPIHYYDSKPRFVGPYHYFKKHPVFEGLEPGHMLDDRFAKIIPLTSVRLEGAETLGGSFGTPIGYHFKIRGCEHARDPRYGSDLAIVPYGKGKLIISTYRLAENLGKDPVAERLLWNMVRGV